MIPGKGFKDGAPVALKETQIIALSHIAEMQGAFLGMGVGDGKTLVSFLAGMVVDVDLVIVFIRPAEAEQTGTAWGEWGEHFRFHRNTKFLPFSVISKEDGTDLLTRMTAGYRPERVLMVVDEAHGIRHQDTARAMRLMRYFMDRPKTKFVAMTGTLTNDSIKDFSHLACMALGVNSPVPYDDRTLEAWAACIDADGKPGPGDWLYTDRLIEWHIGRPVNNLSSTEKRKLARAAFQKRLHKTRGVYITTQASHGSEIRFYFVKSSVPAEVLDALARIEEGIHPAGIDYYESEMEQVVDARRVSIGLYYVWDWSKVGRTHPDMEWMERRKKWNRSVRFELSRRATTHYDSPKLVAKACQAVLSGHPPKVQPSRDLIDTYRDWAAVSERYNVETMKAARWVSTYLIDETMAWVRAQPGSILIWYADTAVGELLATRYGLTVYGEGSRMPVDQASTCAASIKVHGTGRNLQPWNRQIVLGCPGNGQTWEQLLGRMHRHGQTAEFIDVVLPIPTARVLDAFENARRDAAYIEETTGQPQRLMFARMMNPIPRRRELP